MACGITHTVVNNQSCTNVIVYFQTDMNMFSVWSDLVFKKGKLNKKKKSFAQRETRTPDPMMSEIVSVLKVGLAGLISGPCCRVYILASTWTTAMC